MNRKEILTSIKELVGLAKTESVENIEVVEEVILSTEEVVEDVLLSTEEVIEEVVLSTEEIIEDVVLAEDDAPAAEAPVLGNFATVEELANVKQELLSMLKAMMEDKSDYNEPDVPAKLSIETPIAVVADVVEEVVVDKVVVEDVIEEVAEEVVHSPEAVTETSRKNYNNKGMTAAQRVWSMINN